MSLKPGDVVRMTGTVVRVQTMSTLDSGDDVRLTVRLPKAPGAPDDVETLITLHETQVRAVGAADDTHEEGT